MRLERALPKMTQPPSAGVTSTLLPSHISRRSKLDSALDAGGGRDRLRILYYLIGYGREPSEEYYRNKEQRAAGQATGTLTDAARKVSEDPLPFNSSFR